MTTKFELFFERMKKAASVDTDKGLCEYLGVKKSTLSMWKSRERVDYELVFTKFEHENFDWLLKGSINNEKNIKSERIDELKYTIKLLSDKIDLLEKENSLLKKEIESATDYYIAAEPSTQLKKPVK